MSYGNNNNNWNNNRGNNNQQKEQFKKSSFEFKMVEVDGSKDKMPLCWGFKKAGKGNGIIKLYARPYAKSKLTESGNGNVFCNLFVTLTNSTTGQVTKTSGLFNMTTKKLVITELGLVGSTNGRGKSAGGKTLKGYFGKLA
jgi:hypothetical protein